MSPQIQQADEKLRIRWLVGLTVLATIGAVCILRLDDYLSELHTLVAAAQPDAPERAKAAVRWVLTAIVGAGSLFSLYLGWLSWRIVSSERYPPPGSRVLSDTRILSGAPARHRGLAGLLMAALTLLLTLAVAARAHRVFNRLLTPALRPTPVEVGTSTDRAPALLAAMGEDSSPVVRTHG